MSGQHLMSLSPVNFLIDLIFGPGSDGDVTIATDTVLVRPMFYQNLHITAGVVRVDYLQPVIYVQDTLTIDTGAALRDYWSINGGNGGNATPSAHGAGGTPGSYYAGAGGGADTNGGDSQDNYSSFPSNQIFEENHPIGGRGGQGGGGAGRAGGMYGAVQKAQGIGPVRNPLFSFQGWWYHQEGKGYGILYMPGVGGGGGGSGSYAETSHCGGGGAGGEPAGGLWVFARHIVLNGVICADGGNGGAGGNGNGALGGGGGGGGGGAGGYACIVCQTVDNPARITANGGTKGAGGSGTGGAGVAGEDGEDGEVDLYC